MKFEEFKHCFFKLYTTCVIDTAFTTFNFTQRRTGENINKR